MVDTRHPAAFHTFASFRMCRFCRESHGTDKLVKYGVRQYACYRCFLDRKGVDAFWQLHSWQRRDFPALLLRDHGLLDAVMAEHVRERNP